MERSVPRRRTLPVLVGLLVALLVVGAAVVRASDTAVRPASAGGSVLRAADPATYLVFSRDGVVFGAPDDIRVFGAERVWVPGDRGRKAFWLRNEGPNPGDVLVRLVLGPGDTLSRLPGFSLRVRGRVGRRALSPDLTDLGSFATTGASPYVPLANHLRPGRRLRVQVIGRLAPRAGNRTQRTTSDVRLQVLMVRDTKSRDLRSAGGGSRG